MKRTSLLLTILAGLALSSALLHASTVTNYWDANGTNSGAGAPGSALSGNWTLDTFWTLNAEGTNLTAAWVPGAEAVFAAGTDAITNYDVYVDVVPFEPYVAGITFEEGPVSLQGGDIRMTNDFEFPIIAKTNAVINSSLHDLSTTCGVKKTGPGRVTLGGAGSDYGGVNVVAEGILATSSQTGLGSSGAGTVVSNGAALELVIGNAITEPVILNGFGVTNSGALFSDAGLGGNLNGFQGGAVLESHSRINYYGTSNNWWALQGTPIRTNGVTSYDLYLGGNGNTMRLNADAILQIGDGALYKDGTVQLRTEAPSYAREFHWNQGPIFNRVNGWFLRYGTPLGHVPATNYVGAGATLWNNSGGGSPAFGNSWVLLAGASPVLQCVAAGSLTFNGEISGPGGLKKNNDTGTLFFNANNTYSGDTIIRGGTVTIGAAGSLSNSATIDVQTGAVFNVTSNASGFTLQSAQKLMGNGTVWGNVKADGTLSPGASIGTLTFANDLTIAGNLFIEVDRGGAPTCDFINVTGVLTNAGAGTLTVSNAGAALQVGDSFTLFSQAVVNGGAITVAGGGATWTNRLADNGSIEVLTVAAAVPATNLTIVATGPTSYQLGGQGGANLAYNIYASTNVTTPMTNWWLIGTANANGSGVIQYTDTQATNNQRFYRFGQ